MRWLYLSGAIVTEVAASLSLKGALTAPWLYFVVVPGYILAFVFLAGTLRRGMPLGAAYGIWGATGVMLTAALSTILFAEPLTAVMAVGMVLIVGGVLLVEFGSQAAHRRDRHEAR